MPNIARLSSLVYRRLLIFYPYEFRSKFGTEMVEVFEEAMRDVVLQRGSAGAVFLWVSALWELISTSAPFWLQDPTLMAGTLSLVASTALFLALFRAVS